MCPTLNKIAISPNIKWMLPIVVIVPNCIGIRTKPLMSNSKYNVSVVNTANLLTFSSLFAAFFFSDLYQAQCCFTWTAKAIMKQKAKML